MDVQFASDLHLELYDNSSFIARNPFKAKGQVLVLAGDTLPLREFDVYKRHRFFDWCSANFRETLLIPGNHEYYHGDLADYPDPSWEREIRPNVRMYENRSFVVDDTEFILSTLWTHIPDKEWPNLRDGMNDFHLISHGGRPLSADDYNRLHERDLAFIKEAITKSTARYKVVVTHHVPSKRCVAKEFQGSSLESGFSVDLTDFIESSGVNLWVYGHSHRRVDKMIGNTYVTSNPVGYVANKEHIQNFSGERCLKVVPFINYLRSQIEKMSQAEREKYAEESLKMLFDDEG